jgi:uncharacterized membrane protein YkvA (DUF1232 family)
MRLTTSGIIKSHGMRRLLGFFYYLPSFLKLIARLMSDPRVSFGSKLIPLVILAYFIMPADFLPDFLPGLGQLDDIAVLLLGLRFFFRLCLPEVVQEHVKTIAAGR